MKRSILFIGYDSPVENEIGEYLHDNALEAFFAHDQEQAVRIINDNPVEKVVLNMHDMNDAIILRYINRYHPEIEVVLSANKEFDEMISIFKQRDYSRLPRPFSLEMLQSLIKN